MRRQKEKVETYDDRSKPINDSDNSPNVSEHGDESNGQSNDTSGLHDVSESDREPESEHGDVLDKCRNISAGQTSTGSNIGCNTSDGIEGNGIAMGNRLSPNSGTNKLSNTTCFPSSTGGWDHGTTGLTKEHMATSAPGQAGLLPGTFTTGSQVIELPDELNWQPSSNRTNSIDGFLYPNMPMGAPNRFDVTGISAGTLGGMNGDLGVQFPGGNWMFGNSGGWITNKQQNVSFWDMLYGPDDWVDDPTFGVGTVQSAGNEGEYPPLGLPPLPQNSPDLPPEGRSPASGAGTAQNADSHQGQLLQYSPSGPLPLSHPIDPPLEGQATSTGVMPRYDTAGLPIQAQPLTVKEAAEPRVPGERSSRSGRTIIPSTRLEKMNEIGSNVKENIPPISSHSLSEWVTVPKEHLLQLDLGEEWKSCVNAWLALEELLDYGAKTKVSDNIHTLCVN